MRTELPELAGGAIDVDVHFDPGDAVPAMRSEVRAGLLATPKQIPSKYFYDARGSALFERITEQHEYYPTRAERALLERVSDDIALRAAPRDIVELGSGSAKKTILLIDAARAIGTLERYVPVEVSREFVVASAAKLVRHDPELRVHAVVGDFERHLDEVPEGERRLFAFLGGTIGNFAGDEAIALARAIANAMGPTDRLLLGTDLVKDKAKLHRAYNDAAGVTAAFNRNILRVVNDTFDGDFDVDAFRHVAFYDERLARIEMHLEAITETKATLADLDLEVAVARGETIRTEVSCKYSRASAQRLLRRAGLELERWYTAGRFALSLAHLA